MRQQWLTFNVCSLLAEEPLVKHSIPISLTLKHIVSTTTINQSIRSIFTSDRSTHLLHSEMSRCCRLLRVATDLRLVSVILGHSAAWSLLRACELLHRTSQLKSVSWLLPKEYMTSQLSRNSVCLSHMFRKVKAAGCKKLSPSILKALRLAVSATALRATSERWGASNKEREKRQQHLVSRACRSKEKMKNNLMQEVKNTHEVTSEIFCTVNELSYQNAAVWQSGHVIDHNMSEWRASSRNVPEPIYCHLRGNA